MLKKRELEREFTYLGLLTRRKDSSTKDHTLLKYKAKTYV